jgi:hypothetical protein
VLALKMAGTILIFKIGNGGLTAPVLFDKRPNFRLIYLLIY